MNIRVTPTPSVTPIADKFAGDTCPIGVKVAVNLGEIRA